MPNTAQEGDNMRITSKEGDNVRITAKEGDNVTITTKGDNVRNNAKHCARRG